jgi:hypothetical protein
MMKPLRLLPLAALPILFLGATCVTRVEQKGPTGPWIGEVTNTGADTVYNVGINGYVGDAKDVPVGIQSAQLCPYNLEPGQRGYFALPSFSSDFLAKRPELLLPLRLSPLRISPGNASQVTASGVSFRVIRRFPEHNAILVEARNDSSNTYDLLPCAVSFDHSGEAQDVSRASAFLGTVFKPGDIITFPVRFTSPVDGTFQFFAYSIGTDFDTALRSVPFDYSAKVVETEKGRELEVVGEITNTSATDLGFAWYEAYLASSPTVRTTNFVGSSSMNQPFSGNGVLPAGQKTLVSFTLPLDEHDSNAVKITGVIGKTAPFRSAPPYTFSPVPVMDVASQTTAPNTVKISAKLSNPADKGLNVDSVCFYARDAGGTVLGGHCGAFGVSWIEPRGSAAVSQEVTLIGVGQAVSVEVVAYGHAGPKPIPIVPPS